jgi:hypothetical protein
MALHGLLQHSAAGGMSHMGWNETSRTTNDSELLYESMHCSPATNLSDQAHERERLTVNMALWSLLQHSSAGSWNEATEMEQDLQHS